MKFFPESLVPDPDKKINLNDKDLINKIIEKLKCKAGSAIDDINPINYFKNKKKCQEWADNAETVAIGKRWYKDCMDNPHNY